MRGEVGDGDFGGDVGDEAGDGDACFAGEVFGIEAALLAGGGAVFAPVEIEQGGLADADDAVVDLTGAFDDVGVRILVGDDQLRCDGFGYGVDYCGFCHVERSADRAAARARNGVWRDAVPRVWSATHSTRARGCLSYGKRRFG